MKICPNADCPDRKRLGFAPEYRDEVAACAACAAALEKAPAPAPPPPERPRTGSAGLRVLATVGLVAVGLTPGFIPLPGVEPDFLRQTGSVLPPQLSVGALGLLPIVGAFGILELLSLLIPSWRARREDPRLRARMTQLALRLGLLLALVQAYAVAIQLESFSTGYGFRGLEAVPYPGWGFRLRTLATLAGASFLLYALAVAASRRGLGNGFAVFSIVPALAGLPEVLPRLAPFAGEVLVPTLAVAALSAGMTWYVLTPRRRAPSGGVALPGPVTGGVAWLAASSLVLVPFTIGNWLDVRVPLAEHLPVLTAIVAALLAGLLAFAFHPPAHVAALLARLRGRPADEPALRVEVRRAVWRGMPLGIGYCLALGLVGPLVDGVFGSRVASLALPWELATVLFLDLRDEWRARSEPLEIAWSLHHAYALDEVLALLQAAGIRASTRGRAWRSFFRFLDPLVPIDVLVPPADVGRARDLLQARLVPEAPAVAAAAVAPAP